MEVTIDINNVSLEVEGEYIPDEPGLYAYKNGDPGYPPTPSEFEIKNVFYKGNNVTNLIESLNSCVYSIGRRLKTPIYDDLFSLIEEEVIKIIEK